MKKVVLTLLSSVMIFSLSLPKVNARETKNSDVSLARNALSSVIIEQDTGEILYEKEARKELPPASMTKIMTMLLIMEEINKGKLKLDEKVMTSEHAASMGGSQIFLEPGEEMTVKEMLKGIAIASGNDASVAMAEKISGTEEAFVDLMNKKVKQLGLKNTHFENPTGLPAPGHYSSAYDMAIMGRELLKYPLITKFTGTYEDYLRKDTEKQFWLVNTNKLVRFYPGADGLKTGFTAEAKYCLTATAKKNNMRVVSVIMGAPTSKERNAQMTNMLDYAFNQYQVKQLIKQGENVKRLNISKGKSKDVNVVTKSPVSVVLKKGEAINKLTKDIKLSKNIQAPIQKGQVVGVLVLKQGSKVLSKTELVANKSVSKASWYDLFKRTVGGFN
ncbi:D-alanyl-D-alanine carboxypeptidase family protein [Bacillus sp. AFS041924]|uniref:D-alanyl-D-alanine carboxypeptidase family protein n=1 Tax=Bacillus sp. AFS041924 TaxID=2033503 RepID=UPI000BFB4569|nr:D-alanyl-D-alanine carboxypeptidase family protein [Bacillus sp. AFS041924]PGS48078.1 D-alanyl-D-alanine carboxypeptidase [Bacillus sp. AFS041924]